MLGWFPKVVDLAPFMAVFLVNTVFPALGLAGLASIFRKATYMVAIWWQNKGTVHDVFLD